MWERNVLTNDRQQVHYLLFMVDEGENYISKISLKAQSREGVWPHKPRSVAKVP